MIIANSVQYVTKLFDPILLTLTNQQINTVIYNNNKRLNWGF